MMKEKERPVYEVPTVSTYTDEELLNELGHIHAYNVCSSYNGGVIYCD